MQLELVVGADIFDASFKPRIVNEFERPFAMSVQLKHFAVSYVTLWATRLKDVRSHFNVLQSAITTTTINYNDNSADRIARDVHPN